MDADIRKKSVQVYEFLDGHPNYSRVKLKDVFNHFKPKTVDSYYDRWHKKQKSDPASKRSSLILQNNADNADRKKSPPVSLKKIDESLLEEILLSVVNKGDWDLKLAREIQSFLDKKGALKQEIKETPEFAGMNFKEIYDGAKSIISNNEREVPS